MNTPRGLATVGLLKTRLDEGRNYLALYEPFVYDALSEVPTDSLQADDIRRLVQQRSGIVLPTDAIQTLLGRCTNRGYLRRSGGRFFRTHEVIPNPDIDAARAAVERELNARGVTLRFIRPGKPIENVYVESVNGKCRDECLNEHWFVSLADAQAAIETWRIDHNTVRPHSSLAGRPEQFASVSAGARGPRPARTLDDQKP